MLEGNDDLPRTGVMLESKMCAASLMQLMVEVAHKTPTEEMLLRVTASIEPSIKRIKTLLRKLH